MGLDISYDAFSGGYGSFMRFRMGLARTMGIDLGEMEGYANNGRSWDKYLEDPMCILFNHCDCEGSISLSECKKLLPRMKEISEKISTDDNELLGKTNQFINGLEEAIYYKDGLEFG